ncbi:MAG: hypothetical protein CL691_07720 [Cellvibrionales bacterium]|nr:hypothetical protein [Cellvibrionales bacterium]|tara:strand:- start:22772 stop:23029 length:258 start_codon:yes stop_codon:yes gene_type:complete
MLTLSKQHKLTAILMQSLLLVFYPSQAEVISIPLATALSPSIQITVTYQGMTEAQVLDTFGPANSMKPPVGQPAISQWLFTEFTV